MKVPEYRILWKGQISGPFNREQIEEMLSRNEIGVWAEISEGNSDWKPVSEWRIRKPAFRPKPKVDKQEADQVQHSEIRISPGSESSEEGPDLPPLPAEDTSRNRAGDVSSNSSAFESNAYPAGGFFYWALMPLRKYGVFYGRSRRKEYWLYSLLTGIIYGIIGFTEGYLEYGPADDPGMLDFVYLVDAIVVLFLLIPNLAVAVRRLHDTNRSGWWLLIGFTGVGLLFLLLFAVQEGTEGENDYGQDPKGPFVT